MPSQFLLQGLAQGSNPMAEAFDARTKDLTAQHSAEAKAQEDEQNRRDNEMHKVFEYAGDGYVDEARYLAQSKGLQVPEEVFKNATFAKGLDMAGKIYGDDKVAAQKFTQAWMTAPGDLNARLAAGQQAAGVATNPEDRAYNRTIALEKWKLANRVGSESGFTLTPGQRRYDSNGKVVAEAPAEQDQGKTKFVQDALSSALSNPGATPEQAQQAAERAATLYDQLVAPKAPTQMPNMQNAPTPQAQLQNGVYAVQQLVLQGYTAQQIKDTLVQKGATPEQVQTLLGAAGVQ